MNLFKSWVLALFVVPVFLFADNAPVGEPLDEEAPLETMGLFYLSDQYPPVFYSTCHHSLAELGVLDNGQHTVTIEDGSRWKISSYDWIKVQSWKSEHPLTLTQNNRWFSNYAYRLINRATGASIEANLFLGPLLGRDTTRFIDRIDYGKREISLNDYTHWEVSHLDERIFKNWQVSDYIIIGTNSNVSCWDSSCDSILVNVTKNNCARTRQF